VLDFGIVKPGTTLYIPFASYAGSTGASAATTGLAVTDIEIYKDGSVTQRSSDAGYTLLDTDGLDFDGITGLNGFSINLADNTDAGFYAAGSQYWVVVSTVTIDTQTVTFLAATFRVGLPDAVLNTTIATLSSQTSFTLTAGPAEDDALNGCIVYIHDVASSVQGGYAVVQDYTGASKTVTLVAGTTFTAAATDNISIFPPALQPTVWGRTADVTATGAVGIDWGNIENPTSSQPDVNVEKWNTTAVPAEHTAGYPIVTIKDGTGTGEINTNAGAIALVDLVTTTTTATNVTTVNGLAANVITAASIATGAIDADAIADNAIDAGAIAADAITAAKIADGAIDRATFAADTGLQSIRSNTAQTGTGNTITLDASASSSDSVYVGSILKITGGTGVGGWAPIDVYNGTTKVADIIGSWQFGTPDNTSTFAIFPAGANVLAWMGQEPTSLSSGKVPANVSSIDSNAITAASLNADAGTEIGAAVLSALGTGTWASAIPWNASWDAEVQSEVQDAIEVNHLDHLIAVADPGGVVANSSFLAKLVSKSATPAFSSYDNTTDALEALRDNVGTAGAALNAVVWNSSWDAEVESEVIDAIQQAVPDSIPADGSRPNLQQAAYMLVQLLTEGGISGTTWTVKKPDGTTTLFTITLDSATTPTSKTRAT